MRNKIRKLFYASLLLLAFATTVFADTPLVSGQVVSDNGITRYIYTLTNILSSGRMGGFYGMTLPDGSLAIGHSEPTDWNFWYPKYPENVPTVFYWSTYFSQAMLQPGQSTVFEIHTSAPVTTKWVNNWTVGVYPVEGRWYTYSDGTPLPVPVPVPEPSSVLTLIGGIAGLGGFALKRKL